ncbi:MAG: hypothetical protein HYW05_01830 [Candidatus Diapherotrites archaeon]|nr:hypothetical protein [Candidatus Diapherotrites archaeon]
MAPKSSKRPFYRLRRGKLTPGAAIRIWRETARRIPAIYRGEKSTKADFGINVFRYGVFAKVIANEAVRRSNFKLLNPKQTRELERLLANKIYLENKFRMLEIHNSPINMVRDFENMDFFAKKLEIAEREASHSRERLLRFMDKIELSDKEVEILNSKVRDAEKIAKNGIAIERKKAGK